MFGFFRLIVKVFHIFVALSKLKVSTIAKHAQLLRKQRELRVRSMVLRSEHPATAFGYFQRERSNHRLCRNQCQLATSFQRQEFIRVSRDLTGSINHETLHND
ncbi:hypothetical protein O181_091244 [Austropuccinia psidii MF-1]|uniref:Secreted protein n=1 Tax=Austropuccinia psidii MF-1 TaxID=1389203 RepID=A0A9Q3IX62_9BASI|nr:hypothetical protein [Austropuccinia psidii MF-1]